MKFLIAVFCVAVALEGVDAAIKAVGPANGLCAGYDDADGTLSDKSRVYLASCSGDFSKTLSGDKAYDKKIGYLMMNIEKVALMTADAVTGATKKIVDNTAGAKKGDNVMLFSPPTDKAKCYTKQSAEEKAGDATYAFSSTGAYFSGSAADAAALPGAKTGFYAGTATYLATSGTVKTNENQFQIGADLKKACISTIDGKTCGKAREWPKGTYKFSVFGYTKENTVGKIKEIVKNAIDKPFTHLGFRQAVQMMQVPTASTVTGFVELTTGSKVDPTDAAGKAAKGFQLCVDDKCLDYTFPTKYNSGNLVGGNPDLTDGKASTGDIQIQVSWKSKADKSVYIDYMFPVTNIGDDLKWFVYDPEVKSGTKPKAATSSAPSASQYSYMAVGISALALAIAKF